MPKFLDSHGLSGLGKEQFEQAVSSSADEFGVTTSSVYYNEKENKLFCVCEGPDKESVKKHHEKLNLTCDFITEVDEVS